MSTRFADAFRSLTGFWPMKWQHRLFDDFVTNHVPSVCDIPTGLGKTSILPLWLLALIEQAGAGTIGLPRRLVYVVNRRTVVDQATKVVEQMRRRLMETEHPDWWEHRDTLRILVGMLRRFCASDGPPLAVSTLRGELADNQEWKVDPGRPAILVGTIDMIGSKLLFSGYGDGRYYRTHHAGLIGQDVLIVHDEAHLTPAFSELLRAVRKEQFRDRRRNGSAAAITRPMQLIELSATAREPDEDAFVLEPEKEDKDDEVVQARLAASKRLHVHPASDDAVIAKIVELATVHEKNSAKVLVYIRSPEQAQKVASNLAKLLRTGSDSRVALLTGTIRGYERDQLVQVNPVYRALLDPETRIERTVYLVSTSAGEVGIDLDADHLVCDVTTLDALIQRLGRVNRRSGQDRCARVDVVGDASARGDLPDVERAIARTIDLLREWAGRSKDGLDVSPGSLRHLVSITPPDRVKEAFSPKPDVPPLTGILLDAWSLTSVQAMPGRPEVAPYLHGLTRDPPETFVAWRREIGTLAHYEVDAAALRAWFRACPVRARERLRDRTHRIKEALGKLLKQHRKQKEDADFSVVLLDERGEAQWGNLSQIVLKDFNLSHRTILLPLEVGGLDTNGMLDHKAVKTPDTLALDVAEEGSADERRERWLHRKEADIERFEGLSTGLGAEAFPVALREKERIPLTQPEEDEAGRLDLVLLVTPRESALQNPETTSAAQTLAAHSEATAEWMAAIAESLAVRDTEIETALVTAARWHDRGKDRPVWQRYARNTEGAEPLAKARRYLHPRALGGYRHEFGSLLEAMTDSELDSCAERDLVLHLIAAHHGWARPHFEPRSYDTTLTSSENDAAACEVMRRFGRLQNRFGRWGLAWLESLVRCADIAASRQAAEASVSPKVDQ